MSLYAGPNGATALEPGDSVLVFNADSPTAGAVANAAGANNGASLAVATQRAGGQPYGESWEIAFSGAPGAFEVDVQHADTDADANYVNVNSVTAVNANNACRIELPSCWSKFSRLYVKTLTNAVTVTAKCTR